MPETLRLSDLLAALSVATDLGTGHEPEKAVRACLVATELARRMGAAEPLVADVYYTTLLRHLGCTATAHEEAYLFGGDELVSRPAGERADFGNRWEMLGLLARTGRGTGPARLRYLGRAIGNGKRSDRIVLGAICEVAARLAERLGLGEGVRDAIAQVFERWDGSGVPRWLAGEEIALGARLAEIGHQAVLFDRLGGPDAAAAVIRRRAGGWLDPRAAEAFARDGRAILEDLAARDVWAAMLEAEPRPHRAVGPEGLDRLARTFADVVDLKTPFLLGHSREVAELPAAVRLLAAADAFQAMTQLRPHREALTPEAGARALGEEVRLGRLDPECARAVVEAAGVRPPKLRAPRPAGLSEREVEVLRLVALGHSNRQIARRLSISPRTAEHHVQHVYAKTGLSSRAAAALFALEHGLLSR